MTIYGKRAVIHTYVCAKLREKVLEAAKVRGLSISEYAARAIENELLYPDGKKRPKKRGPMTPKT